MQNIYNQENRKYYTQTIQRLNIDYIYAIYKLYENYIQIIYKLQTIYRLYTNKKGYTQTTKDYIQTIYRL